MQAGIHFHLPIIRHFISSTTRCWDITKHAKSWFPQCFFSMGLINYPKLLHVSFILPWFWACLTLVEISGLLTWPLFQLSVSYSPQWGAITASSSGDTPPFIHHVFHVPVSKTWADSSNFIPFYTTVSL